MLLQVLDDSDLIGVMIKASIGLCVIPALLGNKILCHRCTFPCPAL